MWQKVNIGPIKLFKDNLLGSHIHHIDIMGEMNMFLQSVKLT